MTEHDDKLREAVALFRYGLIADLAHLPRGARGIGEKLREKAAVRRTTGFSRRRSRAPIPYRIPRPLPAGPRGSGSGWATTCGRSARR